MQRTEVTGPRDRFMEGVKKWPGPLNHVIKCRYFKQRPDPNARELYPVPQAHFGVGVENFVGPLGNCFLVNIASFMTLLGSRFSS